MANFFIAPLPPSSLNSRTPLPLPLVKGAARLSPTDQPTVRLDAGTPTAKQVLGQGLQRDVLPPLISTFFASSPPISNESVSPDMLLRERRSELTFSFLNCFRPSLPYHRLRNQHYGGTSQPLPRPGLEPQDSAGGRILLCRGRAHRGRA